jgi:hypothetical protein
MSQPTADRNSEQGRGPGDTIAELLAVADRLEGHGQYNLAKLTRAAADALARRAAHALNLPPDPARLVGTLGRLAAALPGYGLSSELAAALVRGTTAMGEGRLPLIDETPDPYVCRACGELHMAQPIAPCPRCGAWPATFQRFRPVYWLDALGPRAALAQLEETPRVVAGLLAGLDEAHLSRPADDGGWSMRQIVAHLRDAEGVLRFRVQLMIEQANPTLESLAVFAWATEEGERPATTTAIFETYQASRRETMALLQGLPPDGWQRLGQHKEFGQVTIQQQASYFSAHEQTHLAALVALREAAQA